MDELSKKKTLVNFHKNLSFVPTKSHEKSGMEVMAGSNGIPADAGRTPVEKSPEEKCLGRLSSDPGPR